MRISLLTDAPKHNLALMKISTWHKARGDEVFLNMPLMPVDIVYASQLFEWSTFNGRIDYLGGPGADVTKQLPPEIDAMRPDYSLYEIDHSLGYTYRFCPRKCPFCKVHHFENNRTHYSIWDFHDSKFDKICLLNNNTFADPQWLETFEEIWDADLILKEHGFDLRLLDEEKCETLKKTRFENNIIHFAWDRLKDEKKVLEGLAALKRHSIKGRVYVLVGFETTREEDIYRCQKIIDYGHEPYIMPFGSNPLDRAFKRCMDTFLWRKIKVDELWKRYKPQASSTNGWEDDLQQSLW